jgi:uncharacterized protein
VANNLQRGIHLFNDRQFFHCHEVLEEAWKPLHGPCRSFLQALIHLAVGMYHWQQGNTRGAIGQFRKGLRKLESYLPAYEKIDTARLYRDAETALNRVEAAAEGPAFFQIHPEPGIRE